MNEQSSLATDAPKNAGGRMGAGGGRLSLPLPAMLVVVGAVAAGAVLQWIVVASGASPIWLAAGIAASGSLLGGLLLWWSGRTASKELERTTSLLDLIGDALPSLIYAKDREGRFVYANRALLQLYGCELSDLVGRTDADFARPEDAEQYRANDRRVMARATPEEVEERVVRDGRSRLFLSAKAPLRDQGGQVVGVVGISTDVTGRHQQQEQLVRLAQRAETAQRAARASLYEIDLVTGETLRDPLIADLCGVPPEGIGPGQAGWEQLIHPDDREDFRRTVGSAVERFERFALEYRVLTPDGRPVWIADTGQIIRDEDDGRPRRLIGLVADVTERKAAEERERLLAREVDHRAKNLLAVVQSVVQLTRADDPETLKADVTGRIQSLARAHSLLAESRWEGVDLGQLALEELAPFAHTDHHRVLLGGPELRLKPAAAQSLAMVLHELATNAAKYGAMSGDGGRLELGWSLVDKQVELVWREFGGPPSHEPTRTGFGSRLIKSSVERQLRGSVAYDWRDDGLHVRLAIPQDHVTQPPEAGAAELHEVLG